VNWLDSAWCFALHSAIEWEGQQDRRKVAKRARNLSDAMDSPGRNQHTLEQQAKDGGAYLGY
jgi:hypothetical protein